MEHPTFKPNGSAFLILLLPITFFSIFLYQQPNLYLLIFFLAAILFAAFMCNRKTNKICITEDAIVFLPFWGHKTINKIYFSDIKNIKLVKTYLNLNIIKNDDNCITIPLKSYENHLKIIDVIKEKSNTDVIETVITQGITYLLLSASLIYFSFDLINRFLTTTEHNISFISQVTIFIFLLIFCSYIGKKITKQDTVHRGIIITFCAVLATSLTYALTISFELYNEHYPLSTYHLEIKLDKKDGNYQTWQLSNEVQKTVMIKQDKLSTHIKPQQLPANLTLTQGSKYQVTIQTGLLGDVFILPASIKATTLPSNNTFN